VKNVNDLINSLSTIAEYKLIDAQR